MIESEAKLLVDTGHGLVVRIKIVRQSICRLLLVEAGDDADLSPHHFQTLLLMTRPTFHIPASSAVHPKRSAPDTLFPSQKVGRATKNVLSCFNHSDIVPR